MNACDISRLAARSRSWRFHLRPRTASAAVLVVPCACSWLGVVEPGSEVTVPCCPLRAMMIVAALLFAGKASGQGPVFVHGSVHETLRDGFEQDRRRRVGGRSAAGSSDGCNAIRLSVCRMRAEAPPRSSGGAGQGMFVGGLTKK
jgi:hypothetical protein